MKQRCYCCCWYNSLEKTFFISLQLLFNNITFLPQDTQFLSWKIYIIFLLFPLILALSLMCIICTQSQNSRIYLFILLIFSPCSNNFLIMTLNFWSSFLPEHRLISVLSRNCYPFSISYWWCGKGTQLNGIHINSQVF